MGRLTRNHSSWRGTEKCEMVCVLSRFGFFFPCISNFLSRALTHRKESSHRRAKVPSPCPWKHSTLPLALEKAFKSLSVSRTSDINKKGLACNGHQIWAMFQKKGGAMQYQDAGYRRRATGTTVFGGKGASNLANWRTKSRLRSVPAAPFLAHESPWRWHCSASRTAAQTVASSSFPNPA